ncbi:MAG: LON peptidase substrate-binding domain-containing protein [Solirubrobacteraceae bacterium]
MPSSPEQHPTQPSVPKPTLRLIPLEDTVVFPSMGITLTVEVGDDERVVLVPRHENEFLEVGTVAEVSERLRLPGGGHAVAISGQHRALIGAAQTGPEGELRVEVDERPDESPVDGTTRNLEREYRAIVEEIRALRGADGRIAAFLRALADLCHRADLEELVLVAGDEHDALVLADVDRQRDAHVGEHDGVLERNQTQGLLRDRRLRGVLLRRC